MYRLYGYTWGYILYGKKISLMEWNLFSKFLHFLSRFECNFCFELFYVRQDDKDIKIWIRKKKDKGKF